MPRTNVGRYAQAAQAQASAPAIKKLEDKLIELYGFCMTLTDVASAAGINNRKYAKQWVEEAGILPVSTGTSRKRYLALDIARALENSKYRAS